MAGQEMRIFFEITRVGNMLRCAAIDEATGIEAVIVAPAGTPELSLKVNAKRKLLYVMKKQGIDTPPPPPTKIEA